MRCDELYTQVFGTSVKLSCVDCTYARFQIEPGASEKILVACSEHPMLREIYVRTMTGNFMYSRHHLARSKQGWRVGAKCRLVTPSVGGDVTEKSAAAEAGSCA